MTLTDAELEVLETNTEAASKVNARLKGVPGVERINTLSDGVFAIVITLLVLELRVPEIPSQEVQNLLPLVLRETLPKVASHIVSFIVLGIYWVGHHNMFMHIKRHDRVLLWLNILFLMCVASMPFPTGLIVQYGQNEWSVIVYAGTLVATGLSLDLIWWYATTNRRLVNQDMSDDLVAFVHRRVLTAPAIYLAAILLSLVSINAAKLLFLATALLYILPNPLDQYHQKEAHKKVSTS
jgi:uncharacterized membrane protein